MTQTLFPLLARHAADGERTFLTGAGGLRLSYADAFARAARYAAALSELGATPGDRIAAQTEKSVEALLLYLGCVMGGFVYLPLNTAYTVSELAYFISDAEPAAVICDPARRADIAALPALAGRALETLGADGTGSLAARADQSPARARAEALSADSLAAILYTSGTTGRSKGAMLTQANLRTNAEALIEAWRFTREDVLVHALPIYHTHGLFVAANIAIAAGAAMRWMDRFEPSAALAALQGASVFMGVPTYYTRLLKADGLTADATRGVRLFVSGSAPLLPETHREFEVRTGHRILERYGMTETGIIASNPYDGERLPGSVGYPLRGVETRVTDPVDGAPLAAGRIGMIEVRGPNVFQGYWRQPEKTAAEMRPGGWFITGDLGVEAADGRLSIVGRNKDLVISGGLNVYPKEVEDAIDALPGVEESAVFGIPDTDFGEAVTAAVVLKPGAAVTEADVSAALGARLAAFKRPKRVHFVDALPRNAMGKVQKTVLRDRYAS